MGLNFLYIATSRTPLGLAAATFESTVSSETYLKHTLDEVFMALYNPELEKAIARIQKANAKLVCLQLPDGMKPMAQEIEQKIHQETGARVLIWLGSNFGACDIPLGLNKMGVDMLISWGHNVFHKKEGW